MRFSNEPMNPINPQKLEDTDAILGILADQTNGPDKTKTVNELLAWHTREVSKATNEARKDQIMQDFLCYNANLDVDESELIEIREHQLDVLAILHPKNAEHQSKRSAK